MSNQTPAPETVLLAAIRVALKSVNTAIPGQILSYDPATCQADVQPLVMRSWPNADGTKTTQPRAVVPHVPVLFVGGGGMRLTFPVKVGDTCLLIFADSSLDRWSALGGLVDPLDDRHHHVTDGIAIVGLSDLAHASPAHATATVLEGSDVRLGDASGSAPALNSEFAGAIQAMAGVPSGLGSGDAAITALQNYVASHGAAAFPVGATKVKVT